MRCYLAEVQRISPLAVHIWRESARDVYCVADISAGLSRARRSLASAAHPRQHLARLTLATRTPAT